MKLFKRHIQLKVKKLDSDERILYLANKLYDELETSGRNPMADLCGYVTIWHHTNGEFKVENNVAVGGGWLVKGSRRWPDV